MYVNDAVYIDKKFWMKGMVTNMKKKVLSGVLAFGFALAVFGSSVGAEPKTAGSEATFKLVAGTTITEPATPGDGEETGQSGPVSIDYVPHFKFGEKSVSPKTEIYTDVSQTPNVQITDLRGNEAGWELELSATAFKTTEGDQLNGAILRIKKIAIANPYNSVSASPTAASGPVLFGQGELGAGVTNTIMTAADSQGGGTWLGNFYDGDGNQVELEVPAGNKVDSYKSTLTWTLTAAP